MLSVCFLNIEAISSARVVMISTADYRVADSKLEAFMISDITKSSLPQDFSQISPCT